MRSQQEIMKEPETADSALKWLWDGMLHFTKYAVKNPAKLGLGLLLLSTPIIRSLFSRPSLMEVNGPFSMEGSIIYPIITPHPSNICMASSMSTFFAEYIVSTNYTVHAAPQYLYASFPKLEILPSIQFSASDNLLPPDKFFTREYLIKQHALLEKDNILIRGDDRTPEEIGDTIPPKCLNFQPPHYDLRRHRLSSDCSGLVSLTHDLQVAHAFGAQYFDDSQDWDDHAYYLYMGEMRWGLVIEKKWDKLSFESEHSAIGPVPLVSHRKCHSWYHCDSIFIREDLDPHLKEKILKAQLLPHEMALLKSPKLPEEEITQEQVIAHHSKTKTDVRQTRSGSPHSLFPVKPRVIKNVSMAHVESPKCSRHTGLS